MQWRRSTSRKQHFGIDSSLDELFPKAKGVKTRRDVALALIACCLLVAVIPRFPIPAASAAQSPHGSSAPLPARKEPRLILCLGDSLTAGYGLDQSQAYPALLEQKIHQAGWDFQVINAGVSGETSAGGLRRLEWYLKRQIDVLILALGGNDALRGVSLESTEKNLDEIINKTQDKYPHVKVIVSGMLIPPSWGPEYANKFRGIYPALAKKHKALLIPFLLEGVGGNPKLNFPDGIHPTVEGHMIVAENVWKVLKPLLASM